VKNIIRTLSAALIAVSVTFGAAACGGDPCATLMDKICDGDKDCIAEAKKDKNQPPKEACEAMLKDDKNIEAMKGAMKAKKEAEAAAKKATEEAK
jgi:hypothetical protein